MAYWARVGALGACVSVAMGCAWIAALPDNYALAMDGGAGEGGDDTTTSEAGGDDAGDSRGSDGSDDSADAGKAYVAPDGSFCSMMDASGYLLCADFDEDPYEQGFTREFYGGGQGSGDTSDSVSPPRSYLAVLGGGKQDARLDATFDAGSLPAGASFQLQMKLSTALSSLTSTWGVMSLEFVDTPGMSQYAVVLEVGMNGYYLKGFYRTGMGSVNTFYNQIPNSQQFVDVWTSVDLELMAGPQVLVTLPNGAVFGPKTLTGLSADQLLIRVGPEGNDAMQLHYDNVTFAITP